MGAQKDFYPFAGCIVATPRGLDNPTLIVKPEERVASKGRLFTIVTLPGTALDVSGDVMTYSRGRSGLRNRLQSLAPRKILYRFCTATLVLRLLTTSATL